MYQMSRIGPGPAAYDIPTTVGFDKHDTSRKRQPMYTLKGRPKTRFDTLGPGPNIYKLGNLTRNGAPHTPQYSLGRRFNLFALDNVPGPGAHYNEKVPSMKGNRAPEFSFGYRLVRPNTDKIPGPEYSYDINVFKNRNPSYSLRRRTNLPYSLEGPGPNTYENLDRDITHKRSPKFSMRRAYPMMGDKNMKPGPNEYNLVNMKPGASAPQYSFGRRHSMWNPPMIIPGDNC